VFSIRSGILSLVEGVLDSPSKVEIRTALQPQDVEAITELHRRLYADEGFGPHFVRYVADGVGELLRAIEHDPGAGRVWLPEVDGRVRGSIAIVRTTPIAAQLRWFLLAPELRSRGLGRRLLTKALAYAEREGYESVFLQTVKGLDRAAKLYRTAGFVLVEEHAGAPWGDQPIEQRYELRLSIPHR
jgi:ribosomal protein S18 acetylase RimI-like enzyme